MGPCVNVMGMTYGASNGGIEGRAKKKLYSGITHMLIILKFKKASDLGWCDV